MIALQGAMPRGGRPAAWAARAWRRMNWRHILLAIVITLVRDAIHPLGGIYFPPVEPPGWDPLANYLSGCWLPNNLVIVYGVLVADAAFDDGVTPLRAYGTLVVALVVIVPSLDRLSHALVARTDRSFFTGYDEGGAQLLWWSLVVLYESGFALTMYAYWRVTQRALRAAQASETARMLDAQRVQTAQLLALQSRVEPQLLFDALERVGILHRGDPGAADELLADLIALLRAIQPSDGVDSSTLQRECGLVEAWVRVTHSVGQTATQVQMPTSADSLAVDVAPMLILPLIRAVLAVPQSDVRAWRLSARAAEGRLVVALAATADAEGACDVLRAADFRALNERLARLFGPSARLALSDCPPSVTLDLPRLLEDSDDDRADR